MSETKITNPDLHSKKGVDGQGRVYLGKEWANKQIEIVVKEV